MKWWKSETEITVSSTVLIHFYPKLKLDDNIGEKKVPQLRGVSISENASAFQRSVNNLATLAYATEAVDYTSTGNSN